MRAERFGDDADIGEKIVDVRHHSPHHAEPHVMVRIDQPRHDDACRGIDHLGAIRLDVCTDRDDTIVLDQNVADREIGDGGIHRYDGAALE